MKYAGNNGKQKNSKKIHICSIVSKIVSLIKNDNKNRKKIEDSREKIRKKGVITILAVRKIKIKNKNKI